MTVTVAISLLCCWPLTKAGAEEVSRQPPPVYREKLAAFLTPLDAVLRAAGEVNPADHDGVVLLDEEFHYIDEKGRRYWVDHRVNKAVNDSGAKENAEEIHGYRKANQKIHLILAQTILPDGKRMPVRPGAAILQSPQRQADDSLYDDHGELRLIFPNVKSGAVTESIVLIEESRFRIPGEFTASYPWAAGWPIGKLRRVLEMPSALADRLKISVIGHGVPEVEKQQIARGRTRLVWESGNVRALRNEPNRPPTEQVGPALWLTTLPDWDALVKWYAPLVGERSKLKPSLSKQIDEWTKDAHTPAETIGILMARVARDVRYTGLEFGVADLQPHDCNEVWENQYGDCKDKANLLRAMLQHKGITAYLTLINTEHVGRVERRSPDYRQFNHAIVAVEREPGQYLFCDPTISFAGPGLLSPNDADRDVLLVKPGPAEWAHTPGQDAGSLHFDLELKLAADGELSGWLTQDTKGYYGVADAEYFRGLDKDRLRERARETVQGFFKGAEIVDVTKSPMENWDGTHRMKAFFVVPGTNQQGQGRSSLAFPRSNSLFVDPGSQKERETPYYLWRDFVSVTARIKLPDGFAPAGLPRPFQINSAALDGSAQWTVEGSECRATLDLHLKQNLIPAEQFAAFFNGMLSLHSWLDNPLTLVVAGGKPAVAATPKSALEDFPMMSDGEGQLELVERRFPSGTDAQLRREALQKVMQYFPTDKATLFSAGVRLAIMDWEDGKAQEAAGQIDGLLKIYKSSVRAEDAAWGEYMLAITLKDAQQPAEALKIFERLSGNGAISQRRRAWSSYQRARLLEGKSATSAIKAVREGLAFDTDAQPISFTLLAKLLIMDGRIADLKKEIKQLLEKKPPQLGAVMTRLAESAGNLLPTEKGAQRGELMQILEDAQKSAELGAGYGEALQSSQESIRAAGAAERIRENLKKYLAKNPLPELDKTAAGWKTRAEFSRGVADSEKNRKPELCLRYGMELLARFEPNGEFPMSLWKATSHADWKERLYNEPEPLLPVLFDLSDQLPVDDDAYIDGRFLRAKVCLRHGDVEGAQKIHEELLQIPTLSRAFKVTAHSRLADNLETRRDYAKALEIYRTMEGEIEFVGAKDALLRAALLNLEMNARAEALRILELLAARSADAIKQASTGAQIAELAELTKDRQKAEAYWDASAKWWPAWLDLEQKFGLPPQNGEQIVPVIPDLEGLGVEVGNAMRGKDREAFFRVTRRLAHAARWQPSMAMEFLSILTYVPGMDPPHAEEVRKFAVTITGLFVTENPDLIRRNLMYGAMNCIDTAQSGRALEIIHTFQEKPALDDPIAHAMARLWAIAAQRENRDLAPATAAVEKALASPALLERGLTVGILANLYRRTGRAEDEEKLLKREIADPRIKEVDADLQALTARYREVTQAGEESKQFSIAVENWLKKWKPAWYDFAEPKKLEDPRLSNLETVLKDPSHLFSDPEIVKLDLLVAVSSAQSYERRQDAFLDALGRLADRALTSEETRDVYEPLLADAAAPESLRVEALWHATLNARLEERKADFEKLRAHPLVAKFNERTKNAVDVFHEGLAVDSSSPEAIAAFCERLMQKELVWASLMELRDSQARLLALEKFEAAEKIYRRLATADVGPDAHISKTSLQMEFLTALNRAKKWAPATSAMRAVVLAQYPEETIREPAVLAMLHNRHNLDWLEEGTVRQVRLYQIKNRDYEPADFTIWRSFLRSLPASDASRKLGLDMIAAALEHAPGDSERASAIAFGAGVIDVDDAGQRNGFIELVRPYRKAEEFPVTFGEIRLNELFTALRTGEPVDLEFDFAHLHRPGAAGMANRTKLRHYVQTRDAAALRKMVETIGPDELLSDRLLDLSLRAFAITGMNDELELARDTAKKSMYQAVLQSWHTVRSYDIADANELAELLGDVPGLPEAWFHDTAARTTSRLGSETICAGWSCLHQEWPRLLQISDEALANFPTHYHFHWFRALALYHLDRKPEAIEPLRIFVRYSKDEAEYPKAMEMLKELEGGGTPEAKPAPAR